MRFLYVIYIWCGILTYVISYPITYENVRGTPYKVGYDPRAITINGVRTMLISGAIHYPRSTPGMWPYLFKMAKNQGLNTIQTYVFWNIHEQKQGVYDFSGRANLSKFLQDAADAGLFVNLRVGPYVCAEWNYGGLPVWLNEIPNIRFRSSNDVWKSLMRKFMVNIIDYVRPYLAKNGGPIILAQIENELHGNDTAYIDFCDSLVTNEFSGTDIVWTMCSGNTANSTVETCNGCNCLTDGWIDQHRKKYPNQPLLFTENEGWFQQWGDAFGIRATYNIALSVAQWFAGGGAYHSYYMWHGGNNYGRTAASGITTVYADDVCLHSDGTPNEPKYTHLSRLQHFIGDNAQILLSQDSHRTILPWWNEKSWESGTDQFVYSYPPYFHFVSNNFNLPVTILFLNQSILMSGHSIRIYDNNLKILWDSSNYSGIISDNTQLLSIVPGPFKWKTWSESNPTNLPKISSISPLEQLNITNDETVYLWYRYNVTLKQALQNTIVKVQTSRANGLVFFLNGQYLGEFNNHDHTWGFIQPTIGLDLSQFEINQQYLFEILSVTLGIDSAGGGGFEKKGILGNVWLDEKLLIDNQTYTNFWEHQKGLIGEYYQIYTKEGSTKVDWNSEWTKSIGKPITWFQSNFDLDHLIREDTNANPILLDAQGLNRGHAFINGNDLGLYWLIQGICHDTTPCCCQDAQINCLKPTQRYYHIPSDWLMTKNNLITIFDDLGASSPQSVNILQRVITN